MSKEMWGSLVDEVQVAVMQLRNVSDASDEAAAVRLGVNRTDMRCMGCVFALGPMTAGEPATAARPSPSAATIAIDRLERAECAQRVRDVRDFLRAAVNRHAHQADRIRHGKALPEDVGAPSAPTSETSRP
ncbi:hypothetical protein GCM10017673_26640 [Streptosporangium violaceochromogenes]|nr:hypothetical protein GCM10017673_26640 [Streptosporangium violaceochromogenes]